MDEPRIGFWHPDFAGDGDRDLADVARLTTLLGPFMATYHGLTIDDYWALTVSEHAAMLNWLYETEILAKPGEAT